MRKYLIKNFCIGVLISLYGNVLFILNFCISIQTKALIILTIIPDTFLVYNVVKNQKLKLLLLGGIIILSGCIMTEIFLQYSQIRDYFYYKINENASEYSMGAGIIAGFIWFLNFASVIIGMIVSRIIKMPN